MAGVGSEALPVVRFFISSPGDVKAERNVALSVIRRLQAWFQGRLLLVPILWEQEPLLATAGFQQEIDRRAPPSATDVAVFILWARLGTPLSAEFELEDGRRPTGTEWEFEDAARAHRERELPHILAYRRSGEPLLKVSASDYERRRSDFAAVETFFRHHFQDSTDLSFKGSYHHFTDTSAFGQLLEGHLLKLLTEQLAGDAAARVTWPGSPFRGLETFEAEHAPIFFGRTRALQEVRQALAVQVKTGRAFVLILGPSGNGKSSLAKAGLLPLLAAPWVVEESLSGGLCRHAVMNPGRETTPLGALCAALLEEQALPDLRTHGDTADLAEIFSESPRAAVSHVRGALRREAERAAQASGLEGTPPARLVLLVDQLEELFAREAVTDTDRDAFAKVIDALARSTDVWVLATLRSDFYPAFSRLDLFMELKEGEGHYDLAMPSAAETAQLIRGPAQVAGLAYETDAEGGRALDDVLITEATRGPDALPLLEYALLLLEEQKLGNVLTFKAYEAMGGIEGAIGSRAEEEWERLSEDDRGAFPSVLRALVEVGSGAAVTRRRAPLDEVVRSPGARGLVDRFVGARLLVADGDGEEATVSVAHEALLRTWPRASEKIAAETELLRIRSRVRSQAARWDAQGRESSLLLAPGKPLEEALLLQASGFDLTELESEYVEDSQARARRWKIVRRTAVATISLLAVAACILAGVAVTEGMRSRTALRRARAHGLVGASLEASTHDHMLALLLAREALQLGETSTALTRVHDAIHQSRERVRFEGHENGLNSAAFSPDGRFIVTASADKTARIWTQEGTELELLEHKSEVRRADFSADGRLILTISGDGPLLWSRSGEPIESLYDPEEDVRRAVFLPDAKHIVTVATGSPADEKCAVHLWNTKGERLHSVTDLLGQADSVEFSPDGRTFVSTGRGNEARLYALDGRLIATLGQVDATWKEGGYSRDGTRLLTCTPSGTITIWDSEGTRLAEVHMPEGNSACCRLSPDGESLVTCRGGYFGGGPAHIWDLSGAVVSDLEGANDISSVSYSPDGTHLAGEEYVRAAAAGTVMVWSASGQLQGALRGHTGAITSYDFSPDGRHVLTASEDATARLWEIRAHESTVLETARGPRGHGGYAFLSPQGDSIVALQEEEARLHGVDGGLLATAPIASGRWAAFSPDGSRILMVPYFGTSHIMDAAGGKVGEISGLGFEALFMPDGSAVLAIDADNHEDAVLLDLEGRRLARFRGHESRIEGLAVSPHGDLVATCSRDCSLRMWARSGGPPIRVIRGHRHRAGSQRLMCVESVSFSPRGDQIVSTGWDEQARVWDLEGRPLFALTGHVGTVWDAAFSPDGELIATAGADGTVRIWDQHGQPREVLRGHSAGVLQVQFFPDGGRLLTASEDGTARVWLLRPSDLLHVVEERVTRDFSQDERKRYEDLLGD